MFGLKVSRGDSLDRHYIVKALGCGIFIHRIHHSDPVGVYHNHPWSGLSIIFGHYDESYQTRPGRWLRKRGLNWIEAGRHHNVHIDKPVWTVFLHLPKSNKWEIVTEAGAKVTAPWEGAEGKKSYTAALQP